MKLPSPALSAILLVAAGLFLPGAAASQVSARYSFSADNPLQRGAAPAGEVGVHAGFLDWRASSSLTPATKLDYGFSWGSYRFSAPAASGAPDHLQKIAVTLGATHRLDSRWLLIGSIQPGLFSEMEGSGGDAFNVPALFLATWRQSRELAWSFGLRADPFADKPVLPLVGVRWRFAPRWEFTLGFPRAGFSHEATNDLKLGLGATVQGGSFHIATDPRPAAAITTPRLDNTFLDYREIRVGLVADYKFNPALSLALEAGLITDQKLDYYERGFTLNGDTAAFFTVGLTGTF